MGGSGSPCKKMVPRAHLSPHPNSISIGSAIFVGFTIVTERQTDRPTDHATPSVTMGCIVACSTVMWPINLRMVTVHRTPPLQQFHCWWSSLPAADPSSWNSLPQQATSSPDIAKTTYNSPVFTTTTNTCHLTAFGLYFHCELLAVYLV